MCVCVCASVCVCVHIQICMYIYIYIHIRIIGPKTVPRESEVSKAWVLTNILINECTRITHKEREIERERWMMDMHLHILKSCKMGHAPQWELLWISENDTPLPSSTDKALTKRKTVHIYQAPPLGNWRFKNKRQSRCMGWLRLVSSLKL